jgi:hypothetical protein
MYYVIKLENRPDGITNSTMESRQAFATAMSLFYSWASTASATELFTSVALTVMDNNGEIIENKLIPTAYTAEG